MAAWVLLFCNAMIAAARRTGFISAAARTARIILVSGI
jgi:hypothetical protein